MPNILLFCPDRLDKPSGGMGEQARKIVESSKYDDFFWYIIGNAGGEPFSGRNFKFYPVMDINAGHGQADAFCETFLYQTIFYQKALEIYHDEKINFDIIHAFDYSTFWAALIVKYYLNLPLITTIQLSIRQMVKDKINPLQTFQYQIACSLEMKGLIQSDAIIQVSESYALSFPKFLLPKTFVINNGIDLSEYTQSDKINLPGTRPIKLIYIGRYAEMKNVTSILNAKFPDNIDIIFIGNNRGGLHEIFERMTTFCKDNDFAHYVGPKYGQEKVDYLFAADAVIMPSVHEPFGIVALEALASRSILLSSFVDGLGDFLTEDIALNCGTTPESISNSLNSLINLSSEEKQIRINKGIDLCRNMSWEKQAGKLTSVYNQLLQT